MLTMKSLSVNFLILFISGSVLVNCANYDNLVTRSTIYYMNPVWKSGKSEIQMLKMDEMKTKKNIKIIVHGYLASRNHVAVSSLKNAYLSRGYDNIFMADWMDASILDYPATRGLVKSVGLKLAKMLETFIRKYEIDPDDLHILGHSLGAHIAGEIGRYFKGNLGRVTGLDPALPLFTKNSTDGLQSDAAQFVDVIHSDSPVLGDPTVRGHADFYPNFGITPQPGCNARDLLMFTSCSHYRAPIYYAESIGLPENFPAVRCSIRNILNRKKTACIAKATDVFFMGEYLPKRARGTFFLETNNTPPFGFGRYSKFYERVKR